MLKAIGFAAKTERRTGIEPNQQIMAWQGPKFNQAFFTPSSVIDDKCALSDSPSYSSAYLTGDLKGPGQH